MSTVSRIKWTIYKKALSESLSYLQIVSANSKLFGALETLDHSWLFLSMCTVI